MWRILTENNVLFCDEEFKTKKEAKEFLKEAYLETVVPFLELDPKGKLEVCTFKDFLTDFIIKRV
jgi:hypothetical protein